ncbi:hypothetical protein [Sphingomonas sp. Leaf20]|jgi:hypothetical protein|uniref:hypothetical protein n=1 Tax=Sphingomonas sp. Leaf20 TaxID=1735685 RepID=UPI0006F989E7|nr:hypothetical protein [Sphingomonas sp. Leaf20]KQM71654.1 hypothetical protein ASE72_09000 [Sphingomonas sp. Leaf20]
MAVRSILVLALAGASLTACATGPSLPPTEVLRYHLGEPLDRGTIAVQPLSGGAPASLEFKAYAAAVQGQLIKVGYNPPAPGTKPLLVATVAFTRTTQAGPPKQSPFSIGIGGGGFSGGRGGGGVGLGGGVGIPIGGGGRDAILVTEMAVTIKRTVDQSPVWEGRAQTFADARKPDATSQIQAEKLARALFAGFPGESGRTIQVK